MIDMSSFTRHCTNCGYFREDKPYKCKEYYWTGIPSDHHPTAHKTYPDTFAPQCPQYTNTKRHIYKRK